MEQYSFKDRFIESLTAKQHSPRQLTNWGQIKEIDKMAPDSSSNVIYKSPEIPN